MASSTSAAALVDQIRAELAPIERKLASHPFISALARGEVPTASLARFAGEQHWTISSDRRSFAYLIARYADSAAGELFLSLAQGEGTALCHLGGFARWLGLDPGRLSEYEPTPGAHAYTAYVSWLALNGSATDAAVAFLANLAAWGANCGRAAAALRSEYGADDTAVAFFEFFATPAPGFEEGALAVIEAGLRAGDSPARSRTAARLLQAYELMFWDTMMAATSLA
jgi:thiaminase